MNSAHTTGMILPLVGKALVETTRELVERDIRDSLNGCAAGGVSACFGATDAGRTFGSACESAENDGWLMCGASWALRARQAVPACTMNLATLNGVEPTTATLTR